MTMGFKEFVMTHLLERSRHYKRADIARIMGVSAPAVTLLLRPDGNPTLATVEKLLIAMDILDECGKRKT